MPAQTSDTLAAKQALLQAITEEAGKGYTPKDLLRLAEAYAWLTSPSQSHGGGASES